LLIFNAIQIGDFILRGTSAIFNYAEYVTPILLFYKIYLPMPSTPKYKNWL